MTLDCSSSPTMGSSNPKNSSDMADSTFKHSVEMQTGKAATVSTSSIRHGREYPTEQELNTLRRVSGKVRWTAYTIAFVELCERFSYHGTTAVCKFPLQS